MQPSDFLTTLGIVIAVWAFVPKKERNFFLSFFSKMEIYTFLIGLIYIHFLMSFDWLKKEWIPGLSIFTLKKGIPASALAYAVALILIAYPIIKVSFSFFSRTKSKKLLSYYNDLFEEGEVALLVGYIQKYHIDDISKYLKGLSYLPEEKQFGLYRHEKTKTKKAYNKLIAPKRIYFAELVYWGILNNEMFVKAASTKYPELFAKAFQGMETKNGANRDLVKLYIECLFEAKNQDFIQELKIAAESRNSILSRKDDVDLPILSGILTHTQAAYENYVWYPVGEGAVKSLKYDDKQKEFLLKPHQTDLEDELWNHKIWIAIVYFEYMVRETIYRYNDWHMWLHYFTSTTDNIIDNIPKDEHDDESIPAYSFNHFILDKQFEVMFDWLELAVDLNTENQVIDTITCFGKCLDKVCQTDGSKIRSEFKINLLDSLISVFFRNYNKADNKGSVLIIEWIKKLLLNPDNARYDGKGPSKSYLAILSTAWDKFDKVPYQYPKGDAIEIFENDILKPLGILKDGNL